jgi:hypothetical protein
VIWHDLGYTVARGEQSGQGGHCSNAAGCGSERFFAELGMLFAGFQYLQQHSDILLLLW